MNDPYMEIEALINNVNKLAEELHATKIKLADALKQIKVMEEGGRQWRDSYDKLYEKKCSLVEKLQDAEDEIIILKAKLYDLTEGKRK